MLSQANEIHCWSHQKCSRHIRGLQLLGILTSPEQHAVHHRRPFDTHYCTVSDFLNPSLAAIGFWRSLEVVIRWTTGIVPRPERAEA